MKDIIQKILAIYPANTEWDVERTARAKILLPEILEKVDGDILEIGAHCGTSTQVFCEIAQKFGRKVHVIDPWDGRQEGSGEVYNVFMANTNRFSNCIVHKYGSETTEAINAVKDIKFAFILIDGLHGYDSVVNDFTKYSSLINTDGVICIDDWTGPYTFCELIRRAITDNLNQDYCLVDSPNTLIERYIVRL